MYRCGMDVQQRDQSTTHCSTPVILRNRPGLAIRSPLDGRSLDAATPSAAPFGSGSCAGRRGKILRHAITLASPNARHSRHGVAYGASRRAALEHPFNFPRPCRPHSHQAAHRFTAVLGARYRHLPWTTTSADVETLPRLCLRFPRVDSGATRHPLRQQPVQPPIYPPSLSALATTSRFMCSIMTSKSSTLHPGTTS